MPLEFIYDNYGNKVGSRNSNILGQDPNVKYTNNAPVATKNPNFSGAMQGANTTRYDGGSSSYGGGTSGSYSNLLNNINGNEKSNMSSAERDRDSALSKLENEFKSVMGGLDVQEQNLSTQLPNTIQQIEQGFNEVRPNIERELNTRITDLTGQEQSAQTGAASQINQARRLFNELQTRGQQFAGTSAGDAYGELLGRSTAENIGNVRNELNKTLQSIQSEIGTTRNFYTTKLTDLERNKNLQVQQAQNEFRAEIAKINQARRDLSSKKPELTMDALARFQNRVAEIRNASMIAKNQLEQWAAQKQLTLSQAQERAKKQFMLTPQNLNVLGYQLNPQGLGTYQQYLDSGEGLENLQGYLTTKAQTLNEDEEF